MDVVKIFQGAMTLVAALAWNQAAKSMIDEAYPMPQKQVMAEIVYSIVITLTIIVIVYVYNHMYYRSDMFSNMMRKILRRESYIASPCSTCNCCKVFNPVVESGAVNIALNDFTG